MGPVLARLIAGKGVDGYQVVQIGNNLVGVLIEKSTDAIHD